MFKNYLITAFRNLCRERAYAAINIIGLALAMACALILVLFIRSELTYDQHFKDYKRIFRINSTFTTDGETTKYAISSYALGPLVKRAYPDIGEFTRFIIVTDSTLRTDDITQSWDHEVVLAEDNVFNTFGLDIIYGDPDTALIDPLAIAVSESMAKFYFGDENPIGKILWDEAFPHNITLVYKDLPDNTHMRYKAIISRNGMASFGQDDSKANPGNLMNVGLQTYFKLNEDISPETFAQMLDDYYIKYVTPITDSYGQTASVTPLRIDKIHFDNGWSYDLPKGNIFYIYAFFAIAAFVILVACINYTNLAIARFTRRTKEFGMRRIMGASKQQLAAQFLLESIVYCLIAFFLGIALIEISEVFTPLNSWLNKAELLNIKKDPSILLLLLGFSVVTGLSAGAYPAIYITQISPSAALNALKLNRSKRFQLRNFLVFFQFFVSITVLACTLLMYSQMQYVHSKPLGFSRDNQIAIHLQGIEILENIEPIKNTLLTHPDIVSAAESYFTPGFTKTGSGGWSAERNNGESKEMFTHSLFADKDFLETMGISIIEGRDFSQRFLTDIGPSYIVNEALAKSLQWDTPIGKKIENGRVIGVAKDFHFDSLHKPIMPLIIGLISHDYLENIPPIEYKVIESTLIVRLSGSNIHDALNFINETLAPYQPDQPFDFTFFNDTLNSMYKSEQTLMALTGSFSIICILISCMGLYGLSAYTTEQRRKEISIHRVLGSSAWDIVLLLSKKQIISILMAAALASAVSFFIINKWLGNFSYHTAIDGWAFIFATLVVATIAFGTLALQTLRVALSNPIDSLRYE